MIYLDNAATTKVCPEAAQTALEMMTENFGNPSSTHGPGRAARDALKSARADIAATLNAKPEEIFFTSGGSESDNWAIRSGAWLRRHQGRHIISSTAEHDAVRKTLDYMESKGWEVTRLSPGPDGAVAPEAVAAALRPDTALVSLMLVNNETGAVTDIPAVARAIRAAKSPALLHTDAVQGYMKLPLSVRTLGADMVSLSAHKIHGMKGTGALYIRSGIQLPPLILGGGQENGRRSGTEGLPGICAFAAAAKAAQADTQARERMAALRQLCIDRLQSAAPELVVIGGGAPHILSLSLPGYRSEVLLNYLDSLGISVSKGSACKRGARSHVLEAMGLPAPVIDGAIRVSLCRFTTEADILGLCDGLLQARERLCRTL
ncbi:MAG: cysteine desulfurase [Oscillospiraceae bacterium]|nr:cysteine desulfurase [Oscillospiraceae bacterium]